MMLNQNINQKRKGNEDEREPKSNGKSMEPMQILNQTTKTESIEN
jgi:hypothetical protein